MEKTLEEISQLRGVQGTLLVCKDGVIIASCGEFPNDTEFIGACICELYSTAETMTSERFESGNPVSVTIESSDSITVIYEITEDTIFIIMAEKTANRGLVYLEGTHAAESL